MHAASRATEVAHNAIVCLDPTHTSCRLRSPTGRWRTGEPTKSLGRWHDTLSRYVNTKRFILLCKNNALRRRQEVRFCFRVILFTWRYHLLVWSLWMEVLFMPQMMITTEYSHLVADSKERRKLKDDVLGSVKRGVLRSFNHLDSLNNLRWYTSRVASWTLILTHRRLSLYIMRLFDSREKWNKKSTSPRRGISMSLYILEKCLMVFLTPQ